MKYQFRKAEISDAAQIWEILRTAIARRKADGSNQWQDGYPNQEAVMKDIERGEGYVLTDGEAIAGYSAVIINDEPAYQNIEGKWLTNGDFVVVHRVAVSEQYIGKGLAKAILDNVEDFAVKSKIYSLKADTNFDNIAMIKTFERAGYSFCGQVYLRGMPRRAYEKVLGGES